MKPKKHPYELTADGRPHAGRALFGNDRIATLERDLIEDKTTHHDEPESVKFCYRLGLDYVGCSPFRVPIARLRVQLPGA
jgi:hypothetical protein